MTNNQKIWPVLSFYANNFFLFMYYSIIANSGMLISKTYLPLVVIDLRMGCFTAAGETKFSLAILHILSLKMFFTSKK